MPMILFVIC